MWSGRAGALERVAAARRVARVLRALALVAALLAAAPGLLRDPGAGAPLVLGPPRDVPGRVVVAVGAGAADLGARVLRVDAGGRLAAARVRRRRDPGAAPGRVALVRPGRRVARADGRRGAAAGDAVARGGARVAGEGAVRAWAAKG